MLSLGPGLAACLKALLDHKTERDDSPLFFHFLSRVETNNPTVPEMNNLRCRTSEEVPGKLDCAMAPCP